MTARLGRYRFPLRLILTIPFLLQVLVTVGALGYCFWRSGEESISRQLTVLSTQDRHLTQAELARHMQGAANLTRVVADDINTGNANFNGFKTFNKTELDRLGPYLQHRRAAFSPQSIVTITTQSGHSISLFSAKPTDRHVQTSPLHLDVTLGQSGKGATVYGANAQGKPEAILRHYPQRDVKLPRWVETANGQLTWQSEPTTPLGPAWVAVRSLVLPDGGAGAWPRSCCPRNWPAALSAWISRGRCWWWMPRAN
ncbi:MAG: hypothetical protein HC860_17285 [Alkalinema sp. RU_4_3]|nr:hypothetical protein [Alkalinema sp. RU_4_3]